MLSGASWRNEDPNSLIEATESLYNAPCMATCLSMVVDEHGKYSALRENCKQPSLSTRRNYRLIRRESMIEFLNVFTDK